MNTQASLAISGSPAEELFALSDEQILEIEPELVISTEPGQAGDERNLSSAHSADETERSKRESSSPSRNDGAQGVARANRESAATGHQPPVTSQDTEPPPWLAAQMKDPWGGEEAREFWNGVQLARSDAAACQEYRSAIASPEDARALKELYPGGVVEARTAAERARLLDELDRAYFGGAGNSPEQTSASRAQLADRMFRDDPAAFRQMVELGLRVLQQATEPQSHGARSLGSAVAQSSGDANNSAASASSVAAQHAAPLQGFPPSEAVSDASHLASYSAFEKAANDDLERSVGATIERTLQQALPNLNPHDRPATVPVRERLGAAIRQDVERALQGDRQLGEQVAQILSSRRFDNASRAQVVRLINDRAQQLVPSAAKRVLNDWTQTTLTAHRARAQRSDASSAAADLVPASDSGPRSTQPNAHTVISSGAKNLSSQPRRVDYRKVTDEQILDMG